MRPLIELLVEPAMYFAIGFLVAALMSLPLFAIAHRRAERLTREQLDSLLPMSVKELEAEKDLLRAEYAVSAQRLESALHDLRAKTTAQQIEIGRHGSTVATLKSELGAKARSIAALEAREAALKQQLRAIEQEHALKSINLDDARRTLGDREAALARLAADLGTRTVIAEQQNLELARARASVEALKIEVQDQHRLQVALDAGQRAEASLRYEIAQLEERRLIESKAAAAERANREGQIAQLMLDRQQLQWELAALRCGPASGHATEQVGAHDGGTMNGRGTQAEPQSAKRERISLRELHAREASGPLHPVTN